MKKYQKNAFLKMSVFTEYNLIIMDRTAAPCGMPKRESLVSLKAGSTVNVSWHLGYPHRGKSALLR